MDRQNELVTGLPRHLDAWEQTRVMKQLGSFALISFQVISYFGLPCFSDFISVFQVSVYTKKNRIWNKHIVFHHGKNYAHIAENIATKRHNNTGIESYSLQVICCISWEEKDSFQQLYYTPMQAKAYCRLTCGNNSEMICKYCCWVLRHTMKSSAFIRSRITPELRCE